VPGLAGVQFQALPGQFRLLAVVQERGQVRLLAPACAGGGAVAGGGGPADVVAGGGGGCGWWEGGADVVVVAGDVELEFGGGGGGVSGWAGSMMKVPRSGWWVRR
jgi:hypothetical protein